MKLPAALALAALLLIGCKEQSGRYAINRTASGDSTLIIDTSTGECWVWSMQNKNWLQMPHPRESNLRRKTSIDFKAE